MDDARLYEFDQDEWWDVCRSLRPELTRDEYEIMWDDFIAWKCKRMSN